MGDRLRGAAGSSSSVLPRPDLLDDGLLDYLFLLLLDLLRITKYQTVVHLLFLLVHKWLLIENIGIATGKLFTVDDVLRKLGEPSLSSSLPGSRFSSRCKRSRSQSDRINHFQLTETPLDEVDLLITIVPVDIFLIQHELTAQRDNSIR